MLQEAHTAVAGPAGSGARTGRSGASAPLGLAGLCLVALALTWAVAELVPAAQTRDAATLYDFALLSRPHVDQLANALLDLLDPLELVLWTLVLAVVALVRRRPRVALAAALVMALAPLSSEVLKPLLAHPHDQVGAIHIDPASWPSGHSTAALALGLCAVLVAPTRMRPLLGACAAAFAAAVGCALLVLAWHMPSDVFGGYLLAALWMALAVAGLRAAERRWPSRSARPGDSGRRGGLGPVGARIPE